MKNIFGWEYPPGCSGPPSETPGEWCETCLNPIDLCVCPECPICGTQGDPHCYENGHLNYTEEQLETLRLNQRDMTDDPTL